MKKNYLNATTGSTNVDILKDLSLHAIKYFYNGTALQSNVLYSVSQKLFFQLVGSFVNPMADELKPALLQPQLHGIFLGRILDVS